MGTLEATGELFAFKHFPESASAFANLESEFLKQIKHPHVVEIVLSCQIRNPGNMSPGGGHIMRPVADGNLLDLIRFYKDPTYAIQPKWFACIANAVAYVHSKGIAHGDIKPASILFKQTDVFLADFGAAWEESQENTTGFDPFTPLYSAPEIHAEYARNKRGRNVTDRFLRDAFSLGCTFFELLFGYFDLPRPKPRREGLNDYPLHDPRYDSIYANNIPWMHDEIAELKERLPWFDVQKNALLLTPLLNYTIEMLEEHPKDRLSVGDMWRQIYQSQGWKMWDKPKFYCSDCQRHSRCILSLF